MMLIILGRPNSINVRKVLWTADELGLPYRHEPEWAADKAVDTPEFRDLNPNALVPVVVDGDAVLWESNPICRYLASKHGRIDLLPIDPLARAEVEKWMDWQATTLTTTCRYAFMALIRRAPGYRDADRITRSADDWNRAMRLLDAALAKGSPYVAAERFTLADVAIGLSVNRWRAAPISHADTPSLERYMERLTRRPAARWFDHERAGTS